jgi:tetratricopeptide (TPR) repeat protein
MISWPNLAIVLVVQLGFLGIGFYFGGRVGVIYAMVAYFIYLFGARLIIARQHRSAIRLLKAREFERAIELFKESLAFFDRHSWLDRFRPITLASVSAIGYREMALVNIGFCHSQLGNGKLARESYEKCLDQNPECGLALTSLRMLEAGRQLEAGEPKASE